MRYKPMRTVIENIKCIFETNETIYNKNMQIDYLIGQRSVEGLSNEEYTRISEILNKQEIEIDNIRYFVEKLVETLVGKDNYNSFLGIEETELKSETNDLGTLENPLPRAKCKSGVRYV